MILVCPSCETRYFADDSALGEGRRVRCASCGHSWFAKADGGVQEAEPSGLTREQVERLRQSAAVNAGMGGAPHAEYRLRESERRRRSRIMAAGIGWSIGAFLFGTAAAGAYVFREQVAATWPRTASVYKMLGLEVNRYGLDLEGVTARRSFDGTTPVLTVTGAAANNGTKPRTAPQVRVSLRDEAGDEIQSWTDRLDVSLIRPGERVEFSTSLIGPPVETFGLAVTFTGRPYDDAGAAKIAKEQISDAPAKDDHGEATHGEMAEGEAGSDAAGHGDPADGAHADGAAAHGEEGAAPDAPAAGGGAASDAAKAGADHF